jgi:hypothetical protein
MCGVPVVGGPGINFMKRKKASCMTQSSVKIVLFKGWLLKGQSHHFQLKNTLQRQKILYKQSPGVFL